MRVGIHLPQYGRVASGQAITTAAKRAEELGFVDRGPRTDEVAAPWRSDLDSWLRSMELLADLVVDR